MSNREELIAAIDAGNQPDPAAQQAAQQQQQMQTAVLQSQVGLLNAQAQESASRGAKYQVEAQLLPQETALKYGDSNNDGQVDDDFEKRIRLSELLLKERELEAKEREGMESAKAKAEAELVRQLQANDQQQ